MSTYRLEIKFNTKKMERQAQQSAADVRSRSTQKSMRACVCVRAPPINTADKWKQLGIDENDAAQPKKLRGRIFVSSL